MEQWTDSFLQLPLIKFLRWLFESNFFAALLGALVGTFSTMRVTRNVEQSKNHIHHINNINSSISLAYIIANQFISFKSQHVTPMLTSFEKAQTIYQQDYQSLLKKEPVDLQKQRLIDLQGIEPPKSPIEVLNTVLIEKLSLSGDIIVFSALLEDNIIYLLRSIDRRAALISHSRTLSADEAKEMYFGFKKEGLIDNNFPSLIKNIGEYTDHILFFSTYVCNELTEYGKKYCADNNLNLENTIKHIDFSSLITLGIIPNKDRYRNILD